ncbi:MAG: tetratricopeptide repeat protein, partial [Gemmatimonadota bacterium]|nr:tetratricopeptide repeat protein [Gemmatimonadota bacterium]
MPPRERTPLSGAAIPDPNQLTLGGLDAAQAPAPPREPAAAAPGNDDSAGGVAVREPPVCGEWSFDPDESPDARAAYATSPPLARPIVPPPPVRVGARPGPGEAPTAPVTPPVPPPAVRPAARALTPPTPLPALDELKSIHDAHPADEQTALALSSALAKRGNIEGALGVLERAIESGADVVTLRCARAAILSGRLRYEDAERELRWAQKSKPDDQQVLLQQGILACRRAKWREAVDPLARVVKLDPLSGQAHFYLGEAQSKLDRLGEALESYHRAAELDPDNWRAFKGVGIVLDRMGRSAEAAEYY